MPSTAGCWKPPAAAPLIAMLWLSGCAAGGSDSGGPGACPPVVTYTTAEQVRAAVTEEVQALLSARGYRATPLVDVRVLEPPAPRP